MVTLNVALMAIAGAFLVLYLMRRRSRLSSED
jgi:hypothetical protein